MRYLFTILLTAIALAGCKDEKSHQAGINAAQQFMTAWQSDSQHACTATAIYNNGIKNVSSRDDYNNAFVDVIKTHDNDTILIAAQLLALNPEEANEATGKPIIEGLLNGKLKAADARGQVDITHSIMKWIGLNPAWWDRNIQVMVDKLPIGDQMRVYSKITSPQALAAALKADQAKGISVDAQIDALKSIYTPEQQQAFDQTFNHK